MGGFFFVIGSLSGHYQENQVRIWVNTHKRGMDKLLMKPYTSAFTRTWGNTPFKTAKPLFIGSIPIAASI